MTQRKLWQIPHLRDEEERGEHRKVTWLELFFDLFFVVAIAQLAHELAGHVSLEGFSTFLLQMLPLLWLWVGITYYIERFETEGIEFRIIIFLFMLCIGAMAIYAHDGLGGNYTGYILPYALGRLLTIILWIRGGMHNPAFRPVTRVFAIGFGLGALGALTSMFVQEEFRLPLLGFALVMDVVTPLFAVGPTLKNLPRVSTTKHPERYGLFTIVVLGETVVATVAGVSGHHHPGLPELLIGAFGIIGGFSFWWIYFDFVGRRPFKHGMGMYAWIYLHLALYISIVGAGAGLLNMIEHLGETPPLPVRALALGSLGAFLIIVGLLETVLRRDPDEPTHRVFSPAMKIITGLLTVGLIGLVLPAYGYIIASTPLLLVNMLYGSWVWFTQDLEEPRIE